MTFSQRMKLVPVREAIQVESLDNETRAAIWNSLLPFINAIKQDRSLKIARNIWMDLYQQPADVVPPTRRYSYENVSGEELYCRFFRQKVIEGKWYECLDFVEYVANEKRRHYWNQEFYDYVGRCYKAFVPGPDNFNVIFERYMVGYRFVNGEITPIANDTEIQSIEDAIENAQSSVQELLSKALKHLSNRTHPDYAKSIECAISAVESQCCIILGRDNVTLGDAIKQFERQGMKLHSALKDAFLKLYGFTSSEAGIRHGTINPSDVDQSLAKFMLVTCSAFVNYLIENGQYSKN